MTNIPKHILTSGRPGRGDSPLARDEDPKDSPALDWDLIDGLYAYDTGCTDSGIRDEDRRRGQIDILAGMTEDEIRCEVSRYLRDGYLSEAQLAEGYGWEDALAFCKWLEDGGLAR